MALAVCLLFDTRSERLVRELWGRVENLGVGTLESHTHGHHHPHLSYVVLRTWDLELVRAALATAGDHGPVSLGCYGALVFPRGRVSLAASVTADLVARQEAVASTLCGTGADLHRNYLPGRWVPHVTVATRAQGRSLPAVVTVIADSLPVDLEVDRAALIDTGTGRVWRLPDIP